MIIGTDFFALKLVIQVHLCPNYKVFKKFVIWLHKRHPLIPISFCGKSIPFENSLSYNIIHWQSRISFKSFTQQPPTYLSLFLLNALLSHELNKISLFFFLCPNSLSLSFCNISLSSMNHVLGTTYLNNLEVSSINLTIHFGICANVKDTRRRLTQKLQIGQIQIFDTCKLKCIPSLPVFVSMCETHPLNLHKSEKNKRKNLQI